MYALNNIILYTALFQLNRSAFSCDFSMRGYMPQLYRVAQKSKPPLIFRKIALKIANKIRFLRKVKA